MKARQRRRARRITRLAEPKMMVSPLAEELPVLRQINAQLEQLTTQRPVVDIPGIESMMAALMRIEAQMDNIESRASRHGALAGFISGGLVATGIELIKARLLGF